MINRIMNLFPLWAVLFSILAYSIPDLFAGMKSAIIPLLTLIMFGMGMTLTFQNFIDVLKNPTVLIMGVVLQYLLMPLTAYVIGITLNLSNELIAGMVLVGASPGGTASNVITFLAKGRVALSITLTLSSTLLAVLLTPYLSYLYLNELIEVPVWNMFLSVLQIVLAPVLIGTLINSLWGSNIEKYKNVFPLLSVAAIVIIIAIIVALNKDNLSKIGFVIASAVILHNSIGLAAGYFFPKIFRYDPETCRTIAFEVGMQNSGLAVALAIKFYGSVAAIPGAVFSIWHNISGSLLAGFWRQKQK